MKLAVFLLTASIYGFVWGMAGYNWMDLPGDPGKPNLFNGFMMLLSYLLFVGAIVRALYTLFERDGEMMSREYDHPAAFMALRDRVPATVQ